MTKGTGCIGFVITDDLMCFAGAVERTAVACIHSIVLVCSCVFKIENMMRRSTFRVDICKASSVEVHPPHPPCTVPMIQIVFSVVGI